MPRIMLRGATGGGWELLVDGVTLLWDVSLDRAAMAAIAVHTGRDASQELQLGPEIPVGTLEAARAVMASMP